MSSEPKETEQAPPPPRRSGRTRLKAIAVLAVVFVLGAAAGATAMRAQMLRRWRSTMSEVPSEARARFRLEAMTHRLDLSDEQRSRIETILKDAEQERARLTEDCRPQLEALQQRTAQQIDEVLTPEQRVKHQAMRSRAPRPREGRPGPPPDGRPGRHGGEGRPPPRPGDRPLPPPDR